MSNQEIKDVLGLLHKSMEAGFAEIREENAEIKAEIKDIKEELSTVKAELTAVTGKLITLEEKQDKTIDHLATAVKIFNKDAEESKSSVSFLKHKIIELEDDVFRLQHRQ